MFDLRKFLTENQLTSTSRMVNEVSIQQLQTDFVDTGRITKEIFGDILKATQNDSALATWLTARVAGTKKDPAIVKPEDIYKYEQYFNVFKRRKKEYPTSDINQIKTSQQIQNFIKTSTDLASQEEENPSAQKGVSKTEKFKDLKIGDFNGFSVYMIPKGRKDLYPTSCELGSGTEWCTATGNTSSYFEEYIESGPLFIFIDNSDPKNKYQVSFEGEQFMDRYDTPMYNV
jgi:predicted transcriptional regulator